MDDTCQALNEPSNADVVDGAIKDPTPPAKRGRHGKVASNPAIQLKVAALRGAGFTVEKIAKELGIAYVTAYKIVKTLGVDDALGRAAKSVKSRIPEIAAMTIREIIDKKDRRTGFEVLRETGVLDAVNPNKQKRDDSASRITFEFNFPPPPWAPSAVLKPPDVKPVIDVPRLDGPKLDENVQDAEIVPPDTSDGTDESPA